MSSCSLQRLGERIDVEHVPFLDPPTFELFRGRDEIDALAKLVQLMNARLTLH